MIHHTMPDSPAPKYQPILEAVLDSMAIRQAVDGIASQRSETITASSVISIFVKLARCVDGNNASQLIHTNLILHNFPTKFEFVVIFISLQESESEMAATAESVMAGSACI